MTSIKTELPATWIPFDSWDTSAKYEYQVSTTLNGKNLSSTLTPITVSLNPPTTTEPTSNSDLNTKEAVQFSWKNEIPVDQFEFQLSQDHQFREIFFRISLKSQTAIVPISKTGTFYWRVRAVKNTYSGEWSEIKRFRIQ